MYYSTVPLVLLGIFNFVTANHNVLTCANIYRKSAWGGLKPTKIDPVNETQSYVLFHHTKTNECLSLATCSMILRLMQDHHMKALGWNDIGYSFYIGGDGRVYQGRGWHAQGPAITRWYTDALTIGVLGDYEKKVPSQPIMRAARKLVDCAKADGTLPDYVKVASLQQVTPVKYLAPQLRSQLKQWPEWMPGSP